MTDVLGYVTRCTRSGLYGFLRWKFSAKRSHRVRASRIRFTKVSMIRLGLVLGPFHIRNLFRNSISKKNFEIFLSKK